jgi:hypothetical protein
VATHIVAASKEGNRVSVIDFSGEVLATFEPFRAEHGVGVASGDLEGTGIDSIVVTDHRRTLGVYTADGHKLAVKRLSSLYRETEVTVADIDGDGKDEIIVSSEVLQPGISKESGILNAFNYGDVWKKARTLDVFTYHDGRLEKEGILYKDSGEGILRVAFGDIDGDGNPELLVADQGKLKAYRMNEGNRIDVRSPLWQVETGYEEDEHIAAGDIDGDGAAEIAVSGEPDKKITSHGATGMMVMKGTGEKYALALDAFEDLGYYGSCSVALGDIDSDGINEIVVGSGERIGKGSLIRVFESDGTFTGHTITLIDREGVTLSLGKFR